jgi:hypothetical protein
MTPLPSSGGPPVMVSRTREMKIPFRAINDYAKRFGIEGSEFDEFLYLIGVMDAEYLAVMAELQSGASSKEIETDNDGS